MSDEKFIKNITSKDIKLSHSTILKMINSDTAELFEQLCDSADFIFPFLKKRITDDFVKLINKKNINKIFEFSKIYNSDFEDLIVKSWLKFADEELTDEILELFENGEEEQKAYCAKYFSCILDSVALEYLKKYSKSSFEPLKINCAKALAQFGDTEILDRNKEIILNSNDDFESLEAYKFICAYGGEEQIKFVLKNAFNNSFYSNIIADILDNYDFYDLKNILSDDLIERIFDVIIEGYPENFELNTIGYWQIYDYIEYLHNLKTDYSKNLLLLAKSKFVEFLNNDIYSYDLDKNLKEELKNITMLLNSYEYDCDIKIIYEEEKPYIFNSALNVIKEYSLKNHAQKLSEIINKNILNQVLLIKSCEILKEFNESALVDKNIIANIENINTKTILQNLLN